MQVIIGQRLIRRLEKPKDKYNLTKEEIEKERLLKGQTNGHFLPANFVDYIEVPVSNHKVIEYLEKRNRPYECN